MDRRTCVCMLVSVFMNKTIVVVQDEERKEEIHRFKRFFWKLFNNSV